MSKAKKRLYSVEFSHRPAYWGDLGNRIKISGILLEGADQSVLVTTPTSTTTGKGDVNDVVSATLEEWKHILDQTDDPVEFDLDDTGCIKAVHRKALRQISGVVQQKIWARDGFCCMYCGKKMGEVQLTVDHFVPVEMNGEGVPKNLLSACRKCNKTKSDQDPAKFLSAEKYGALKIYLEAVGSSL